MPQLPDRAHFISPDTFVPRLADHWRVLALFEIREFAPLGCPKAIDLKSKLYIDLPALTLIGATSFTVYLMWFGSLKFSDFTDKTFWPLLVPTALGWLAAPGYVRGLRDMRQNAVVSRSGGTLDTHELPDCDARIGPIAALGCLGLSAMLLRSFVGYVRNQRSRDVS